MKLEGGKVQCVLEHYNNKLGGARRLSRFTAVQVSNSK
jgi:hypothetical protein